MKFIKKLFGTSKRTYENSQYKEKYVLLAKKHHTTPEYIYELAHSPIKHAKTYDDMRILDDLVKEAQQKISGDKNGLVEIEWGLY